eukprot:9499457-Pyramimonas_sp.AAC.1
MPLLFFTNNRVLRLIRLTRLDTDNSPPDPLAAQVVLEVDAVLVEWVEAALMHGRTAPRVFSPTQRGYPAQRDRRYVEVRRSHARS